jgi:hypothetical protein
MDRFTCDEIPVFPDLIDDPSVEIPADATAREEAELRMQAPVCGGCHKLIDPYGLALDRFDLIARYRTADPQGRPIDTQVTLDDGTPVNGAVGLAEHLALDDRFAACLTTHWLNYALAQATRRDVDGCATRAILEALDETPRGFADLIAEVSVAPLLAEREGGTAP